MPQLYRTPTHAAAVNDPPVLSPAVFNITDNATLDMGPSDGLLRYAYDVDGDPLTVASQAAPAQGSLSIKSNGALTYVLKARYNGRDSFGYTVSDGKGGTAKGTVIINIRDIGEPVTGRNVLCGVLQQGCRVLPHAHPRCIGTPLP